MGARIKLVFYIETEDKQIIGERKQLWIEVNANMIASAKQLPALQQAVLNASYVNDSDPGYARAVAALAAASVQVHEYLEAAGNIMSRYLRPCVFEYLRSIKTDDAK